MFDVRKKLVIGVTVATALMLSGCAAATPATDSGSSSSSSPAADAVFNDADVTFAQMMIPHHEQAVEMSDTLLAKDGIDTPIRELATQIKDAQQPEIDQLKQWLGDWGAAESSMPGMDHGGGMMSESDMTALTDAPDSEAGRLYIEQMIVHHEGAVEMAQSQISDGKNADAIAMAETIVATQSDEISLMKDLLSGL